MRRPPFSFCCLALLLPLLGAACRSTSTGQEISSLIRSQKYAEAVRAAASWSEREPGNAEAEKAHKVASAAWLLEQARQLSFADRDEEALEALAQASALLPGDPTVESWIGRTRRKLVTHWLDLAADAASQEDLPAALELYERVLAMDPENSIAREGAARGLLVLNWRSGLGEGYYKDGVRSLRDYWLVDARAHFDYSKKYLGEQSRVEERRREVQALMAQDRLATAHSLEERGLAFAAHNEYRLALLLAPDNAEALAGRERAGIEVQAEELRAQAERMLARGDLTGARQIAEQGLRLTTTRHAVFEQLVHTIDEAAIADEYEAALDLERDNRYEQAVAAYGALIERIGPYKDAQQRMDALKGSIQHAAELYRRAGESTDAAESLRLLRQVELVWPDYKDVRERLAAAGG